MKQQLVNRIKQLKDSSSLISANQSWQTEQMVSRSFEIMNFGIWNCDKPFKEKNTVVSNPIITLNDTIYVKKIFLADNSRNILMPIYPGSKIEFDKNSKNLLWMVTLNNQIAIFKPEDFQKIQKNESAYIFKFSALKVPVNSSSDFLNIYTSYFN